ncbi:MAG TPA: YfiR family protein [Steroidobacteraceae bacterium]|nr:YfiR family protein [Steroidobacteraceae bacterium]
MRVSVLARLALVAASFLPALASAQPGEYQVKAVFLFNFGQFVEWPSDSYDTPQAPFVICVVGEDPFGKTLDDVVRGEAIGSRTLVVRRFSDADGISRCNILFVGRNDAGMLDEALAAARGHSVLTVTDVDGAESNGAIIVLYNDRQRIRMRINIAAAKANHLVISSKLLRPAEVVGTEGS